MQNNKTILTAITTLVIGLFAGYLLWGNTAPQTAQNQAEHMMPDGTMMNSDDSDMSSMMMDMNAALKGKTGDDFDQTFLSEMIVHHQGAIDMAELALADAKHQEIKDLAKAIVSAQTKEIAEMKSWQKDWYNQ
jgi:uncharacterized protein (DUF305 family)